MLASDEFQGRKPGTPGEDKTVAYLVEQISQTGLETRQWRKFRAAGAVGGDSRGGDATLTATGRSGARSLTYGKDMVIWTKRAATLGATAAQRAGFRGLRHRRPGIRVE